MDKHLEKKQVSINNDSHSRFTYAKIEYFSSVQFSSIYIYFV